MDEAVENAVRSFESMGASVGTVSIPWHLDGIHLWRAIAVEGATMLMVAGNSMGHQLEGATTPPDCRTFTLTDGRAGPTTCRRPPSWWS